MKNARNEEDAIARILRLREERRWKQIKRTYGISRVEWEEMFESQGRKCFFGCIGGDKWYTDHDHETGKVRGILCNSHNSALGFIEKHRAELTALLDYIDSNKCPV